MIYLDNNSSTRIAPEVQDAVAAFEATSVDEGVAIDNARRSVARWLGAAGDAEIAFTADGIESIRRAFLTVLDIESGRGEVISTVAENEDIRKLFHTLEGEGVRVTRLGLDEKGAIDLDALTAQLNKRTAIVSIPHANAETGTVFQINRIASIIKENSSAQVHIDGSAAAGKIPLDLSNAAIDLYFLSGQLIHGPEGIGSLYLRNGSLTRNQHLSDAPCVQKIVGLGAAADLARDLSPMKDVSALRNLLESEILEKIPNSQLNGDRINRLPNTSNISFENTNGEAIAARLIEAGIFVSTATACGSADHKASPILESMNVPYSYAMGSIGFSLSRYSTEPDIREVLRVLPNVIAELRKIAGG
ncbi:MAG: aminotransferase class V-fold PLP-dependent enzyme [Acidobacteria bacterium]|nr:aminotransferase class V-fold PLP-dependent enzyme [Acidobacteriota bacterium]